MKSRMPFALLALLFVGAVTSSLSCTTMQRNAARKDYIAQQMDGYVFAKPIEEVWPVAREVLFERGYETRDADGTFTVETEWMTESTGRHRYMVSGLKKGENACSVHYTRDEETSSGSAKTGRDYELEWALVDRLDPERAAQIDAEADDYALKQVPE